MNRRLRHLLAKGGRMAAAVMLLYAGVADSTHVARLEELSVPSGWKWSWTEAINERGVIVGTAVAPDEEFHAVLWDRAGRFTDLGPAPAGGYTKGLAINNRGEVLGEAVTGGEYRAVRWDRAGRIELLDSPRGGWLHAVAITDSGIATATAYATEAGTLGLRWDRDGTLTRLAPLPGGTFTEVTAMNADGVVVGRSNAEGTSQTQAVRWDDRGRPSAYPALPGHATASVGAINDAGTAVGVSMPVEGPWHAVSWDRAGRVTDLGAFRTRGAPNGINRRGTIIGSSDEPPRAFVLARGGTMTLLPIPPGAQTSGADDINNRGEIVGGVPAPNGTANRAVWWDRRGRVAELPGLPGNAYTIAHRINDQGTIIGYSIPDGGELQAVAWRTR